MSSSSVYYKFKSQRQPSRVVFDGTSISVWDLKREIIVQNKMGKGLDFDLGLYNADTEEEYKDDTTSIQRSSTVIARRLPPSKPGRGTAQMYVADLHADGSLGPTSRFGPSASGTTSNDQSGRNAGPSYRGPMSVRFDDRGREASHQGSATPAPQPPLPPSMSEQNGDEAAGIAAMFQATTDQWDATQQQMASATYRGRGGGPSSFRGGAPSRGGAHFQARENPHANSDRPPPVGYICFRCGQKGHWIQDCPTNKDPEWDNKPRFKRTTGIPKSMLKTIEAPTEEQRQAGVMITADGTYVVAQVDSATWEKERNQGIKALSRSDVYQSVPSDSSLACPLCSKLLRAAVQTPCCSTRFCEECIQTHLIEHDFACAECEKRIADLGNLKRDEETRKRVEQYVAEAVEKSEQEKEEADAKAKRQEEEEEEKRKRAEEGDKPAAAAEADPSESAAGVVDTQDKGNEANAKDESGTPNQHANVPAVVFNPQLVQQLVMTLSNPQLPAPMRLMLQTQLQAQQVAFMRLQQQQQQQQQQLILQQQRGGVMGAMANNPMMMMMGAGAGGMHAGAMNMAGMRQLQNQQQQWRPPMGMQQQQQNRSGFGGPMGMMINGGNQAGVAGHMGQTQHGQGHGGHFNGRNNGRGHGQMAGGGGGMKREREADFVELGAGNKASRTG